MNLSALTPVPVYRSMSKPMKVTAAGNMYKVSVSRPDQQGNVLQKHEIWMTKEAVQKHFGGMKEDPHNYQLMQFAKHVYDNQLHTAQGRLPHNGLLVTSNGVTHGNTTHWQQTIVHPEVKF